MSEADLYKFFSAYDGEADLSDFTPAEPEELLRARREAGAPPRESFNAQYFASYDDVKSSSLKKQAG